MKKNALLKNLMTAGIACCFGLIAAGCASSSTASSSASQESQAGSTAAGASSASDASASSEEAAGSAASEGVRTIRIGIGNAYNPFCYLDENEQLQGYEYEVLKLIDEKLPQYEFKYEPTEFSNILVGLDTGNYDMGVHGFGWNEERASKYLYSSVPSVTTGGYVILAAAGKDYKSLDDLAGKKIQVKTGSNVANLLDDYNKQNSDKAVEIVFEDSENEQIVSNLVNGVYDAYINEKIDADQWVKQFDGIAEYGDHLFGDQVNSGCYYLYPKKETQLEQDVSAALEALHKEGKTAALSEKILGADYTK